MGKFTLKNIDCKELFNTLEDNSIDLIVTDPPYKVTARGNAGNSGGMMKTKLSMQGKIFKHNDIKPIDYIPEFYRVLKDGSHCYIMTNHVNLYEMLTVAQESGFHFIKSLIWNKGNKIMGRCYMSQFEYILFFRKGKFKQINFCGTADILDVPNKKQKGVDGNNLHDTEKPVDLMSILIKNSSNTDDIVCDPFFGIGATPIACKLLDRTFVGSEIDSRYFDITQKRLDSLDGEGTLWENLH